MKYIYKWVCFLGGDGGLIKRYFRPRFNDKEVIVSSSLLINLRGRGLTCRFLEMSID